MTMLDKIWQVLASIAILLATVNIHNLQERVHVLERYVVAKEGLAQL